MKEKNLEKIFLELNRAKVRYLVVGGLAVIAHGYVRVTMDVDLIIDLEEKNLLKALQTLKKLGYKPRVPVEIENFADASQREKWIKEKGMVVFVLNSSRYSEEPIDVFVSIPFDFDKEYRNVFWKSISSGISVPFVGIKQLIKMKQEANRTKDLLDLENLEKIK